MAAVIANGPGVPMVPRGRGTNIGTLPVSTNNVVQFTVSQLCGNPNGFDEVCIFTVGGTVGTPVLEVSIDGGTTWAQIVQPTAASSAATFSAAQNAATTDTAVSSATGYSIAGLSGLALFRFNAAVTVAPAVVWVANA
jgi:hypothetical protein